MYKIGITSYDEWHELWETHVGFKDGEMDLLYSVWGKTEQYSIDKARALVENLEK